jgi:hypothetical protein
MKHGDSRRTYSVNWKAGDRFGGRVRCLDCARARREGRDHGCLVHVAEDVL